MYQVTFIPKAGAIWSCLYLVGPVDSTLLPASVCADVVFTLSLSESTLLGPPSQVMWPQALGMEPSIIRWWSGRGTPCGCTMATELGSKAITSEGVTVVRRLGKLCMNPRHKMQAIP